MSDELKYRHIVHAVMNTPWAILPDKLAIIMDLIAFRAEGGTFAAEEVRERIGAVARPQIRQDGAIAVLPLFGTISQRAGLMSESSGGTSVETFTRSFRGALADSAVGGILIEADSPGGAVDGVPELADEIYRSRGAKPIVAIANTMAASAAYWLATAADELVVTPSGQVGSIGVLAAHNDTSKAQERSGVKTTLISAGKYKSEASPYEPLSEEAREYLQSRVDDFYDLFVSAVARHRGVSAADVRSGYGEGRMLGAKAAVKAGMADRVVTFDETVARMQRNIKRTGSARAQLLTIGVRGRVAARHLGA